MELQKEVHNNLCMYKVMLMNPGLTIETIERKVLTCCCYNCVQKQMLFMDHDKNIAAMVLKGPVKRGPLRA